jgi:hypothetical protein
VFIVKGPIIYPGCHSQSNQFGNCSSTKAVFAVGLKGLVAKHCGQKCSGKNDQNVPKTARMFRKNDQNVQEKTTKMFRKSLKN